MALEMGIWCSCLHVNPDTILKAAIIFDKISPFFCFTLDVTNTEKNSFFLLKNNLPRAGADIPVPAMARHITSVADFAPSLVSKQEGHVMVKNSLFLCSDSLYRYSKYTMSINRLHSNHRMSQIVTHGNTVYLAGQVAQGAKGGTITEQTADILQMIDALLDTAGSNRGSILSTTIWLTSMDDFAEMNAVWDAWVDTDNPPARACVESPRLATADFQVEIMVTAAII